MIVELPFGNFLGCLHNQRRPLCIEQTEIVIGLRGCPFDQTQRANKRPRKPITADWKIKDRAVRRGTVERGCREGHLAHRILFQARRPVRHAERSALTNSETFRCRAVRYSQSFSDCADCAL